MNFRFSLGHPAGFLAPLGRVLLLCYDYILGSHPRFFGSSFLSSSLKQLKFIAARGIFLHYCHNSPRPDLDNSPQVNENGAGKSVIPPVDIDAEPMSIHISFDVFRFVLVSKKGINYGIWFVQSVGSGSSCSQRHLCSARGTISRKVWLVRPTQQRYNRIYIW